MFKAKGAFLCAALAVQLLVLSGCGGGGTSTPEPTFPTPPPTPPTTGALPAWFVDAFNDEGAGLAVKVGGSPNGSVHNGSVSFLTKSLPLGLFPVGDHGIVMRPRTLKSLCSYTANGNTGFRRNVGPAANSTQTPLCGLFPPGPNVKVPEEFECNYSAAEYAAKFYNFPVGNRTLPIPFAAWELTGGMCHFTNTSLMLEAERALFERCIQVPAGTSLYDWEVRLAASGPTWWNEVVVAPFGPDAVAGIFWVHTGPFRKPKRGDLHACQAASHLKSAAGKLPMFEFANFAAGNNSFYLGLNGIKAWINISRAGGYRATDHFRVLNSSDFLNVLDSDLCKSTGEALIV